LIDLITTSYAAMPLTIQNAIRALRNEFFGHMIVSRWEKAGRPVPPPHVVKRNLIREFQDRFHANTLVETGTYYGDMVNSQKRRFRNILSIEIDGDLFRRAQRRFRHRPSITIVHGDSGRELANIVPRLTGRAIFWLDGRYSGGVTGKGDTDCPILKEIDAILGERRFDHVLLIDDARCFIGANDYPTIAALEKHVRGKAPEYVMKIENDMISFCRAE
jgi:hypothetical protein